MSEVVIVKKLSVQAVTGEPSEDPHGQGFAAVYAEVETSDSALSARLMQFRREATPITLRCAMLDVVGHVTNSLPTSTGTKFVVMVDGMLYRPPQGVITVSRRRRAPGRTQ